MSFKENIEKELNDIISEQKLIIESETKNLVKKGKELYQQKLKDDLEKVQSKPISKDNDIPQLNINKPSFWKRNLWKLILISFIITFLIFALIIWL